MTPAPAADVARTGFEAQVAGFFAAYPRAAWLDVAPFLRAAWHTDEGERKLVMNDLKAKIEQTMEQVEAWFELHGEGKAAPLSPQALKNLYGELHKMRTCMDPLIYRPAYPRFLIDCGTMNETDETVVNALNTLAYQYDKLGRGKKQRK